MSVRGLIMSSLWPNQSGKKFRRKTLIFMEVFFNFSSEIGFFELTCRVAAVTLHFEDLAVQITCF